MVDRARRKTSILLGVTIVLAAIVGIWLVQGPSSDEIDESGPSSESSSGMGRLALVDGSVRADVAGRTYISVSGKRPAAWGKLKLVEGRQVMVVDRAGTITDVMVLSRTRDSRGRLAPLQWVVSKSGVELIWSASGERPWTVKRADKVVDKQAHGHYVDKLPVSSPTRYQVERSDPTTVTYKGKTTKAEGGTTYVLILPAYDDHLVGRSFDQYVGERSAPQSPYDEVAHVFSTQAEACTDLRRSHPEPVGMDAARADNDLLGSDLFESREDVVMVGVSRCDELQVVAIGVTELRAELPPRGPRGTPVIAFLEGGFRVGT